MAHTGLALGELLALAPCGVFRDAAAFLLSQAGHNRDKEFAARIKCPYVLFLKVNLYTVFLQFADILQRIHGIPRKAADGFRDDEVNLAGKGILDHLVEPVTLLCVGSTDPLIRIHADEIPVGTTLDVVLVMRHLHFVTGSLFFMIGRNSGVPCRSAPPWFCRNLRTKDFRACWDYPHCLCHRYAPPSLS